MAAPRMAAPFSVSTTERRSVNVECREVIVARMGVAGCLLSLHCKAVQ